MNSVAIAKELIMVAKQLTSNPMDEDDKDLLISALGHINAAEVKLGLLSKQMSAREDDSDEIRTIRLIAKRDIGKADELVYRAQQIAINVRERFFDKYRA